MAASMGECNICRSPIAEAIYRKLLDDRGISHKWIVDSAATSTYEIGSRPDHRGLACMKRHGLSSNHIARQVLHFHFYVQIGPHRCLKGFLRVHRAATL
uniref:Acid phosphatase 1 n=1 Tax=Eptatretus burgeri TaxID=7764 RepID=A0A8C4N4C8_EPTBU